MHFLVVFLPFWFSAGDSGSVFHFMEKNIAASGFFRHQIQRGSITGDHDGPVISDKFITVAGQRSMADRKCFNTYPVVLVDDTGFFNFCHIYFVAGFIGLLKAVDPKIDISLISLQDMAGHVIQPLRAKYL